MKTGIIIGIVIIAMLIIGGVYFAMNSGYKPVTNSTHTPTPSLTPSTPQTYNAEIKNFAFSPATLTINKGDTVVWTNSDSTSHTVTSDSGSELASSSLGNGGTYSHTFNTAGTYNYHCSIHTSMKAKIIVQ